MSAEVIIPINEFGNPLSPYEAETGVVLPILSLPSQEDGQHRNYHHANFYREWFLTATPGTAAVRYSRLQYAAKGKHRFYHDLFEGSRLPQTTQEEFEQTIWNYSGYVPAYAVTVGRHEYEIVELEPAQKQELQTPGLLTIERKLGLRSKIGEFLMTYAIWSDFDHVKQATIEEFISITPEAAQEDPSLNEKRLRLGRRLLRKGIETAVNPIDKKFRQARELGSVAGHANGPVCAFQVVDSYVRGYEPDYFDTLRDRLQVFAEAA